MDNSLAIVAIACVSIVAMKINNNVNININLKNFKLKFFTKSTKQK